MLTRAFTCTLACSHVYKPQRSLAYTCVCARYVPTGSRRRSRRRARWWRGSRSRCGWERPVLTLPHPYPTPTLPPTPSPGAKPRQATSRICAARRSSASPSGRRSTCNASCRVTGPNTVSGTRRPRAPAPTLTPSRTLTLDPTPFRPDTHSHLYRPPSFYLEPTHSPGPSPSPSQVPSRPLSTSNPNPNPSPNSYPNPNPEQALCRPPSTARTCT